MYTGRTGKLQIRAILSEFDKTLMEKYGVNMLDAKIDRAVAIDAFHQTGCPVKAAELCASRLGLEPEVART